MNAIDKSLLELDISLGRLLGTIDAAGDVQLVFSYDGRPVKAGYHVTEVKVGQFAALDCGANPEVWSEIFVQLWDIEEGDRTHMPAAKFAAIIRKVSEHVQLDGSAKLTFEVAMGPGQCSSTAHRCQGFGMAHCMLNLRRVRQAANRAIVG